MFKKFLFALLAVALIAGASIVPNNAMAYDCYVTLTDYWGNPINDATLQVSFHDFNGQDHQWFNMHWQDDTGRYHYSEAFLPGWQVTHWRAKYSGISAAPYDPSTNPSPWQVIAQDEFTWRVVFSR